MDTEFGATQIKVTIPYEGEQAEGEPTNMGQVLHTTYDALAAWGELLGSQSPGQTIQIMLDSAEMYGAIAYVPDRGKLIPDPV